MPKASGKISVLYISLLYYPVSHNFRWARKQGERFWVIYLLEHCDFQNTLEEMLRDRLVCGINDEQIQHMLLVESSLDFKKSMKLATSMETP